MQVYCPLCEGQGVVYKARVTKLNCVIYICDECDTIWQNGNDISEESCAGFDTFMSEHKLPPLWSELSNIERVWK